MKWGSLRKAREDRGAAAVEMALVLPILMLIVFGIVEFGFVFNRWMSITHSARDGVRRYALGTPAVDAEIAAEAAAPDIAGAVTCTATQPTSDEVQMMCSTTYAFALYIFDEAIELESTALMRKE